MNRLPRIILLTNGNPHGLRILVGLKYKQVRLQAIIHESRPYLRDNFRQYSSLIERIHDFPKAMVRWFFSGPFLAWKARHIYSPFANQVVITDKVNSTRMLEDIRMLQPDYLILGGIGIIDKRIIDTAKYGVLNAHPGLLPWVRGTGVVGCAIKRCVPVGGTLHYVNTGVDRGNIIERRLLAVKGTENSLKELEDEANELVADMMVAVILKKLLKGIQPQAISQTVKYPVCKRLSESERLRVDNQIRQGLARDLFERWRIKYLVDEDMRLPNDLFE